MFSPSGRRPILTQTRQRGKEAALRVLVVDDDPDARMLMRRVLETRRAFQVVGEAADGSQALELMESLKPQLITMDVRMPKMDGIQATRRIKERWPDAAIVGFSSFGDRREEMLEAGANAYILKDLATDEVIALIDTATKPASKTA
jgi:two-component system chemotaxis response regulator CheY